MVRATGISTPFGGVTWEYEGYDDNSAIMYIAVLLESKRLLTTPWSRANCRLPFELDVEYCVQSALRLKTAILLVLNSYKVSHTVLLAINEIIHALNDFLNDAAPVRGASIILDPSNQKQEFQDMIKQLKEKVAETMKPLLKASVLHESSLEQWRMLNNSPE